jgi:hypothetical protein
LSGLQILPDLREDRWQYNGSATLENGRHQGQQAAAWVWRVTNDEGYGAYHNTYTLYVDDVGPPLARHATLMCVPGVHACNTATQWLQRAALSCTAVCSCCLPVACCRP